MIRNEIIRPPLFCFTLLFCPVQFLHNSVALAQFEIYSWHATYIEGLHLFSPQMFENHVGYNFASYCSIIEKIYLLVGCDT